VIAAMPVLRDFLRLTLFVGGVKSTFFYDEEIIAIIGSNFHFESLVIVNADEHIARPEVATEKPRLTHFAAFAEVEVVFRFVDLCGILSKFRFEAT
jgi:hypothetical protein